MRRGKSPETSGVVAIVKEVMQSTRANPILVGILIGTIITATIFFGVALWIAT